MDRDGNQPFKFQLDRSKIEQTGPFGGVDQQVEVAAIIVVTPGDRPEHARIAGPVGLDDPPNGRAVGLERL